MGHPVVKYHTLIRLRAWLILLAGFGLLPLAHAETNDWQLLKRSVMIPERGEVTGYAIILGTNRFSIVPPPRWRVTTSPKERTVTLTPKDYSATVTIELRALAPGDASQADALQVRQRLTQKYPEALVTREYKAPTGVGEGAALDLDRVGKGKIRMSVRHVAVAVDGLLANFTLTAPSVRFDKVTFPFGAMLTSFRRDTAPAPSPEPDRP